MLSCIHEHGIREYVARKALEILGLLERFGAEVDQGIVFYRVADFDGMTANFAVFDITLARHGSVKNHGDFFAAVRALERMFHAQTVQ